MLWMSKYDLYERMINGYGIDFPLALPEAPRFDTDKNGDIMIKQDVKELKRHIRNNNEKYVYNEYYNSTTFILKHKYDVTI
jgi:hypothetical protein